jgi:hypothetical protein
VVGLGDRRALRRRPLLRVDRGAGHLRVAARSHRAPGRARRPAPADGHGAADAPSVTASTSTPS